MKDFGNIDFKDEEEDENENEFSTNFGKKPPVSRSDVHPNFNEYEEEENFMRIDPNNDPRKQFNSNANPDLMNSISTRAIATSLIPKVAVLKKALK